MRADLHEPELPADGSSSGDDAAPAPDRDPVIEALFRGSGPAPLSGAVRASVATLGAALRDAASVELPPGAELGGRFRIEGLLGRGGQAVVYRAHDRATGQPVALKVPRPELARRLAREAQILFLLDHPRIVRVEAASADPPLPYLATELLPESLADRIARSDDEPLPLPLVRRLCEDLLDALGYAHAKGVVHCDLKPANVLLDASGRAKVADFGIGRWSLERGSALAQSLAASAARGDGPAGWAGTPLYMAPEQDGERASGGAHAASGAADGSSEPRRVVDGRADLYALGKLAFEALTLRPPRTLRPASRLRPDLDPGWDDWIFRLVEDDPRERFASAAEARRALDALPRGRAASRARPATAAAPEAAPEAAAEAAAEPGLEAGAEARGSTLVTLGVGPYGALAGPAPSGDPDPLGIIGRRIDRYRILRLRGTGGTAAVYTAEHVYMRKLVAFKMVLPALEEDPLVAARFLREAQCARCFRHPHAIELYDCGEDERGRRFIAMELLDGLTLRDLLRASPRLDPARALAIALPVLDALSAAHAGGVVHRDVKPEAIVLAAGGEVDPRVKLIDFGVARVTEKAAAATVAVDAWLDLEGAIGAGARGRARAEADADPPGWALRTRSGAFVGTPAYAAPEQALGRPVDARADVYAVGVVLFECLTGRRPFDATTLPGLLARHASEPPPSFASACGDERVHPAIESAVRAALAKDPADRPASAAAFAGRLRVAASLAGLDLDARASAGASAGPGAEARERGRSRPNARAVLALLVSVLWLALAIPFAAWIVPDDARPLARAVASLALGGALAAAVIGGARRSGRGRSRPRADARYRTPKSDG